MKNTDMKKRIIELEEDNNFLEFESNRMTRLSTGRAHWMIFQWIVIIVLALIF